MASGLFDERMSSSIGVMAMTLSNFDETMFTKNWSSGLSSDKETLLRVTRWKAKSRLTAQDYDGPCVEGSEEAVRLATDYIKQAVPGFW